MLVDASKLALADEDAYVLLCYGSVPICRKTNGRQRRRETIGCDKQSGCVTELRKRKRTLDK